MTTADLGLSELQEWMSILIRHSEDSAAGADTEAARKFVAPEDVAAGHVVLPNDRMSAFERLDVYNGGYFSRLKEVLETDFPALVHALGDHPWFHLALDYVEEHPSEHPNLNVFNRHLPGFIARQEHLDHRAFLSDLAKLEVLMSEAFDAPEFTPFDMETLLELDPEQWAQTVYTPNPSLRLLTSEFHVDSYLQQVFDDANPPTVDEQAPTPLKMHLAIYRKNFRVWRLNLPAPIYQVLSALVEAQPLGEALAAGGEHDEDFQTWFREWSADGLFTDVRVAPESS